MTVNHTRQSSNLLAMVLSGGPCSKYLATAVFVEEAGNLFDGFKNVMHVCLGKTLPCH
jgi:hypothetical protein